ncbi:MAG TPA: DUF1992 domain-containing protein [Roseiflexaceae bacterium]|nr:DUF1992 domain-containing protein [Roseiflexaceae bacterium]
MQPRDENQPKQPDTPEADEAQPTPRTPATRWNYQSLVDQRIAQAAAEGLMDNLQGAGKPQRLDDDSLVPEESRAAYRLLKSSGFAPPWAEAHKDIEDEHTRLERWLAEANTRWPHADEAQRTRLRAEYRRKLEDLQRTILTYNLTVPPGVAHVRGLIMAAELRKLGA